MPKRELAGGGTGYLVTFWSKPTKHFNSRNLGHSSWTEVGDLNTGRYFTSGVASLTNAACFGGHSPNHANMETWDGTSWTEQADLATPEEEHDWS